MVHQQRGTEQREKSLGNGNIILCMNHKSGGCFTDQPHGKKETSNNLTRSLFQVLGNPEPPTSPPQLNPSLDLKHDLWVFLQEQRAQDPCFSLLLRNRRVCMIPGSFYYIDRWLDTKSFMYGVEVQVQTVQCRLRSTEWKIAQLWRRALEMVT